MGFKSIAAALTLTLVVLAVLPAVFFFHPGVATHYVQASFPAFANSAHQHTHPDVHNQIAGTPHKPATNRKIIAHGSSTAAKPPTKTATNQHSGDQQVAKKVVPKKKHTAAVPNPTDDPALIRNAPPLPLPQNVDFKIRSKKHQEIREHQLLFQKSDVLNDSLNEAPDPSANAPRRNPSGHVTIIPLTKLVFTSTQGGGLADDSSESVPDSSLGANGLPADFNWIAYLALNPDLPEGGILSEVQAVEHFKANGRKEHRAYRPRFNQH